MIKHINPGCFTFVLQEIIHTEFFHEQISTAQKILIIYWEVSLLWRTLIKNILTQVTIADRKWLIDLPAYQL